MAMKMECPATRRSATTSPHSARMEPDREIDATGDDDEGQTDAEDGIDGRLLHDVEQVVGAEEVR